MRLLPAVLSILVALPSFAADDPLHARIDRMIAEGNVAPVASRADDATFLRRIYLDLTGGTPTAAQARSFLADADPEKRAKLVQQLLGSPDYVRHLAATFDIWLMERRGDVHVKTPEWRAYLEKSFAANKPYAQLVSEVLNADGTDEKIRPASKFYLERLGEPDALTRDVGRIFFGKDLQCAQCHDHPHITDYLQPDYYGLNAFFKRTSLFRPDAKKPAVLVEKAEGEAVSKSVFTDVPTARRPKLFGGVQLDEPEFPPGEEYVVAPDPKDKKLKWIPKYSRRDRLAKAAADGSNAAFNRNIANRLWALMMGRGLVEPFDFQHSANPPSHPELLDLLAEEFVRMNFNIQAFLGELALTETYQRGSATADELREQATQSEARLAALETEAKKLEDAALAAAQVREATKEDWDGAKLDFAKISPQLTDALKEVSTAAPPAKLAEAALAESKPVLELQEAVFKPLDEAVASVQSKDKDVVAIMAKLRKHHAEVKKEYSKAMADFDKKSKAATDAKTKLDAAVAKLAEAHKIVDPEQAKVDALEAKFVEARTAFESIKVTAKAAQRRADDAKKLIDYGIALSEAESTRDTANDRVSQLAQGQSEIQAAKRVADDLAKTAKQFADDPELARAVAMLTARGADAESAAADAEQQLLERETEVQASEAAAREYAEKSKVELAALTQRWTENFSVGGFAQLTPEQLCISMMRASGEWERLLAAGDAEFTNKLAAQEAKKNQPPPEKKPDEPKKDEKAAPEIIYAEKDRNQYLQDYMTRTIAGSMGAFVSLFGGQPGLPQTDFFATADQALFLENNGLVRGWFRPSGENLTARIGKLEAPAEVADELYVSILTRPPSPEETARVSKYLAARAEDKANAVQEIAWALVSSTEFRFKH